MSFLSDLRTTFGVMVVNLVRARHGVVIFFQDEQRRRDLDTIWRVSKETKMLISDHEAYQLMMAVRCTGKIAGDIAEIGTYRGGSSKLIAIARGNESSKHIYLFDTFEGLPPLTAIDRTHFTDAQYPAAIAEVAAYLSAYPNLSLHKGIFPESAGPIQSVRFSLVHLDVDLYEATREAIAFFYPRMERGALLISHDYMTAPGVRKAIDEFMADKPEAVFESSWRQCFIVKI